MKIEQCFHGIDKKGDTGFISWSSGITDSDLWVIGSMVRMPELQVPFNNTFTVYPLDGNRVAAQVMFEDKDQIGRRWPFCHVLVFNLQDYCKIGANPFACARAGMFQKKAEIEGDIRPLNLDSFQHINSQPCLELMSPTLWEALLNALFTPERTYAFLDPDCFEKRNQVMETMLCILPPKWRAEFAFCTALWTPREKSQEIIDNPNVSCLRESASYYQTYFNIVSSELTQFFVPEQQGYLEISGDKCKIYDFQMKEEAGYFRKWIQQGEDPDEWILYLEQLGASIQDLKKIEKLFGLKDQLSQTGISIELLVELKKEFLSMGVETRFFSKMFEKKLVGCADDLEPYDESSRRELAELMIEEGLHELFEDSLRQWAAVQDPAFDKFFKWYVHRTEQKWNDWKEVCHKRLDILISAPDQSLAPNFAFWALWLHNAEGGIHNLPESILQKLISPEVFASYADWFLEDIDRLKILSGKIWNDQKNNKDFPEIWSILLEEAHNSSNGKTEIDLCKFLIADSPVKILAEPSRWPAKMLKIMQPNKELINAWLKRFFQTNEEKLHAKFTRDYRASRSDFNFLLKPWLEYTISTGVKKVPNLRKLVIESLPALELEPGNQTEANNPLLKTVFENAVDWAAPIAEADIDLSHKAKWFRIFLADDSVKALARALPMIAKDERKAIWLRLSPPLKKAPDKLSRLVQELSEAPDSDWWLKELNNLAAKQKEESEERKQKKFHKTDMSEKGQHKKKTAKKDGPKKQESRQKEYEENAPMADKSKEDDASRSVAVNQSNEKKQAEKKKRLMPIAASFIITFILGALVGVGGVYYWVKAEHEEITEKDYTVLSQDELTEKLEELRRHFSSSETLYSFSWYDIPMPRFLSGDRPKTAPYPIRGEDWYVKSADITMRWIQPDYFIMESIREEQEAVAEKNIRSRDELPAGQDDSPAVGSLDIGFWLAKTAVTRGQFRRFVELTGYRTEAEESGQAYIFNVDKGRQMESGRSWRDPGFEQTDEHPVVCITWNDAKAFCEWLTKKERAAGRLPENLEYRLPAEAEWEYAARGGRTDSTKFWWGDDLSDGEGRLNGASEDSCPEGRRWRNRYHWKDGFFFTSPVDHYGTRGRNGFGLADMAGNVWEWCLDWYAETPQDVNNPRKGRYRVLRGGSFADGPNRLERAGRQGDDPEKAIAEYGFRVFLGEVD